MIGLQFKCCLISLLGAYDWEEYEAALQVIYVNFDGNNRHLRDRSDSLSPSALAIQPRGGPRGIVAG